MSLLGPKPDAQAAKPAQGVAELALRRHFAGSVRV